MTAISAWDLGQDRDAAAAEPIAIIGLACRLPGAGSAAEFWQNLVDGVESVERSTLEEQEQSGVPEETLRDPSFVPVTAVLDDVEYFDAAFFGMSAREAQVRDPQQRLFLELAHTALEDSGYDPARYSGDIGVYAGSGEDAYQWRHTRRNPAALAAAGPLLLALGSHPDYVATLASYKLNLRGPSLTMHTACSTSLVAVHMACEALRNGECDMALTGGVNIDLPLGRGYVSVDGGVLSPDGHCHAFDARAAGTVWGSGGAVVLVKRLADAIEAGDHIRAVILGNAINNDGSAKVGFSAPSQEGQAAAIAQALAVAQVNPRTISYVEAHGTGTMLGDPIEVAALSTAFRQHSMDVGWCGIGTVKSNIGHLGPAAGIAGLVKTVLALEHGLIPPTLNYESPNPRIDFGSNPFYVNAVLSRWQPDEGPRRASVSSFGMGGTNAHVIVEEAPAQPPGRPDERPVRLIQLSARTKSALDASVRQLSEHLAGLSGTEASDLGDVAFTLRAGRAELKERCAVAATSMADAAKALADPRRLITGTATARPPQVALMFPGQGTQHAGMGAQLYETERTFRDVFDECGQILAGQLGEDLTGLVLGAGDKAADDRLRQTEVAQPALFSIEYALALLWREWGLEPAAMIGHSIGEYVAATLAGVFTLADALAVVAARGRLMQSVQPGAMRAVQLPEEELRSMLPDGLSLAAVNGPGSCVVAGPQRQADEFAKRLASSGIASRALRTSHAFHSAMMDPVLAEFRSVVAGVERREPQLPFLSNVTGDWITSSDATDPSYWTRHCRETVRFAGCVAAIAREGDWVFVECGPGQQLSGLARAQLGSSVTTVPSMPRRDGKSSELETLYSAVGRLWAGGHSLDLAASGTQGRRVPLPTYPWERDYYWIKPVAGSGEFDGAAARKASDRPVDDWFAVPVWRRLPGFGQLQAEATRLLFADEGAGPLADALRASGSEVIRVRSGAAFRAEGGQYWIRPGAREDYDALVADLAGRGAMPAHIVHAWSLDGGTGAGGDAAWQAQERGFFSLLHLVQSLAAAQPDGECRLDVVTAGTQDVVGADVTRPEHATAAGIAKVIGLELPWLSTRQLDLDAGAGLSGHALAAATAEICSKPAGDLVALRGGRRWERAYEPAAVPASLGVTAGPGVRDEGVYLITGGLGGIGITLAEQLARQVRARLVLISRTGLPPRDEWDGLIAAEGPTSRAGRGVAAIRRMERAGAEVLVLAADVASTAAMHELRERVLAKFGRIDGIVHAAGVPGGGMAEVKDRVAAEAVLAPKVAGTLALEAAFSDLDLDFVVLCSSVIALVGGFGQVDYCAANNFLDAYAASGHRWRAPVTSVNWGGWQEVGMAAEVAAPAAFRALQRGNVMTPVDHPLITARYDGDGEVLGWCSGTISASTHWVLDDHRIGGVPVLPGTGLLEAVRCAAQAVAPRPGRVIELRDVAFIEPLSVPDGVSAELRVAFTPDADGLSFEVTSMTRGAFRTHAQGSVGWLDEPPARQADLAAIAGRCALGTWEHGDSGISASGLITFGPRWGNLRRVHLGQGEELALLEATRETSSDVDHASQWVLHPALLDEGTAFGHTPGEYSYLPLGYGRIAIGAGLPARLWSHLRFHDNDGAEVVVADLAMFDDDGREVVSISDFTLRRIDPAALAAGLAAGTGARPAGVASAGPRAQVPGIRPADGATAFLRLVSVDLGRQVAITAEPIGEVLSSVGSLTQIAVEGTISSAMRSDARAAGDGAGSTGWGWGSEHVAPRTELEEVIARAWAEVLGSDRVSVTDDFFDLGGNSLIAVQIIAMVRKETGIRLPMRSLFEDPTVAGAAALAEGLRKSTGKAQ